MKATVNFEWRDINEPTFTPEEIIRKALYDAGYSVGHIFVQGVFDEDKTKLMHVVKVLTYNSAQYTHSTPLDVLYEDADGYINGGGRESDVSKASKNFIDATKLSTEDLNIHSMIKDALAFNMLTTKSDGYIYEKKSNTKIATTREGVAEHLKNPAHDEMLMGLKSDVDSMLNN